MSGDSPARLSLDEDQYKPPGAKYVFSNLRPRWSLAWILKSEMQ